MSTPEPAASPRAWLTSLELHGIKLGLSTIRAICAALGHPQRAFTSVLIAGTNGKGSVAAMTAAAGVAYSPLLTAPDLGFDYGT